MEKINKELLERLKKSNELLKTIMSEVHPKDIPYNIGENVGLNILTIQDAEKNS